MASEVVCPLYSDVKICLALFKDLQNAKDIRKMVMDGTLNACLINAKLVGDEFQVLTAATKAIHANKCGKQITRTLHSEILYNMSGSKNISDSFKKFGLSDQDSAVMVVHISEGEEGDGMKQICEKIDGTSVPLAELSSVTDEDLIKKVYKIKEPELEVGTLSEAIVGRIAAKDFL